LPRQSTRLRFTTCWENKSIKNLTWTVKNYRYLI